MRLIVDGIVYGLMKHCGIMTWFNAVLPRLASCNGVHVDLLLPTDCRGITPPPPVRILRRNVLPPRTGWSWKLDRLAEPVFSRLNIFAIGLWARTKQEAIFQSTYLTWLPSSIPHVAIALDMNHELFAERYNTESRLWLRKQYPEYLRRAVRIIAISHVTKDHLIRYYGLEESSIDVVHLAADPHSFFVERNDQHLTFLSEQLHIRPPYVLYVGERNTAYKNFSRLLDAMAHCVRATGLMLAVAGPGWTAGETSQLDALGLHRAVRLVENPGNETLRILYNCAQAFVFPSHNEGFGIPLLEAMACGTPVLAASTAVFREVAGDAALYFDPDDTADLTRAIDAVFDQGTRQRYVARGLEQVAKYSWDRCAVEMRAVYEKALSCHR